MTLSPDDYWKQGTAQLNRYHKTVNDIIEGFDQPRRKQVLDMLEGPMGEQFMTAPASTRRAYHNAFPCGLVAHSLNVAVNTVKIANALAPGRWSVNRLMFVGLFHDFGKAGTPGNPYYVDVQEDWKRKRGEYFEVSTRHWMPNAELGLWNMMNHGVMPDHEEYAAIRLNDGPGAPENKPWDFRTPPLAMIVHWADAWAMETEKVAGR